MKYQTHTICFNEIAGHLDYVEVGWDRLSHTSEWPEYEAFRTNAIETGALDRYWGPTDSVSSLSDSVKNVQITYNTLEGAEGWYNLIIDADGYPIHPTCLACRIVELNDDDTIGNVVKKSVNLFLNPTTP